MNKRTYYPTVVLSDIHLGSEYSKVSEVTAFLKSINCNKLILNGDIIDGWQLQKGGKNKWKKEHSDFFKVIMGMMANFGTKVIYVRGNHDDFLDSLAPIEFFNISIVKEYTLYTLQGKRYYIIHGDIFDHITSQLRWLAKLGDVGYTFLLNLNRWYNCYRMKRGKTYYSFSQRIKQQFKSAVSYISEFQKELVFLAKKKHVDGIICGHIHQPANTYYDSIHYLNSGDWVETLSALVENTDGSWQIIYYTDWQQEIRQEEKEADLVAS